VEFTVTDLFYYPVKSLKVVSVSSVELDEFGIKNDRRFMLIDDNNKFVTQRTNPKLSQLSAYFDANLLKIEGAEFGVLTFSLDAFIQIESVRIWSDFVEVLILDDDGTDIISEYLGKSVRLAFMSDSSFRQVDREYFSADKRVGFADGFPFLLTNSASLNDLNARLTEPVSMGRFRPNIVFSGDYAFQEDNWRYIQIGAVPFEIVKPCSRCVMTTINELGEKGKEPLKTLASYRKNEYGVCFGQNMVHKALGRISVGDIVKVTN